jgi:hypothetical protein
MSNQPVQEIRLGRIRASIWANQTDEGVRHNVIFTRIYKTGHHWHDTATFGRDDLLLISQAAELAHRWILEQART